LIFHLNYLLIIKKRLACALRCPERCALAAEKWGAAWGRTSESEFDSRDPACRRWAENDMSGAAKSPMLKAAPLWAKTSVKGGQYLTGRLGGVKVLILENRDRKGDDDPSHHLFFAEAAPHPGAQERGDGQRAAYRCPRTARGHPRRNAAALRGMPAAGRTGRRRCGRMGRHGSRRVTAWTTGRRGSGEFSAP
jgi:hypothetical protein